MFERNGGNMRSPMRTMQSWPTYTLTSYASMSQVLQYLCTITISLNYSNEPSDMSKISLDDECIPSK